MKKLGSIPILSPKFFSITPEDYESDNETISEAKIRPFLLSPNLLSFHDEGILSLSSIFKVIH